MPRCRYCHAEITRLDKEICPYCGGLRPLEGSEDITEDVTRVLDPVAVEEAPKLKSRKAAGLFAIFLGVFGAHLFYLGKNKAGALVVAVTAAFIAGLGSLLFFTGAIHNALAFFIPYFIEEAGMIAAGIVIFKRPDMKDGKGDLLR